MKQILINIDLNFSFESVIFGSYVCNTLPDKIITIDLTESELDSTINFIFIKLFSNHLGSLFLIKNHKKILQGFDLLIRK